MKKTKNKKVKEVEGQIPFQREIFNPELEMGQVSEPQEIVLHLAKVKVISAKRSIELEPKASITLSDLTTTINTLIQPNTFE